MKRNVLLIYMSTRQETAVNVQKILTGWGCLIKTRLGIHDDVLSNCSETGLIFLELVGETEKHQEMTRKLKLIQGVDAKLIEMQLD
ncbi:MAG: hypothetical protein SNJ71_05305 [Bacteroidales bacterium]